MDTHRRTIGAEQLQNIHRIGGGSFGDIYRARHTEWQIEVAIKLMNRNVSQDPEELYSEISKMEQALSISNVISVFGMYEKVTNNGDIDHGIVMEYMQNGSLASLQNRVKPVPPALKVRILHEVALGMNRLHDLRPPLLHLDLKLSNVLLDSDLHVRIADFGLSRFKRGSSLAPGAAEDYGGTLQYMPPESLSEDVNYRPTQMFDLYSYGILMWAVLSGQEPYSAAHPDIIRLRIPQGDRPDMKLLETESPVETLEDLKVLMQRCWDKEPLHRPSFRECSAETEKVWSTYKAEMYATVEKVQQILIKMATLSPNDPGIALSQTEHKQTPPSAATSGSHMSSFVQNFQTLHLTENPSQNLGAVPIEPSSTTSSVPTIPQHPHLPKPDHEPHPNEYAYGAQQACGINTPPYNCSTYPVHHPGFHSTTIPGEYQRVPLGHDQQKPPSTPVSTIPGFINMTGLIKNVQIGNNNTMNISSLQHKGSKKK